MATKKQKHAAGLAKREEFLAKEKEIGRKSLEAERRRREIRAREAWEKGHKKHYKFVDECPICTDIKAEQARKKNAEAVERVAAAAKKMLELQVPEGRTILDEDAVLERAEDESIDLTRVSA